MATLYGNNNHINTGPFVLNRDSMQAAGLVGWYPFSMSPGGEPVRNNGLGFPAGNDDAWTINANTDWAGRYYGPAITSTSTANRAVGGADIQLAGSDYTLSIWIDWIVAPSANVFILDKRLASPGNGYRVSYINSTNAIRTAHYHSGGTSTKNFAGAITAAGLFLYTLTYDSSAETTDLYINGVKFGSTQTSHENYDASATQTVKIQGSANGQDIHDLRFYNRILSAGEIWQLYSPETRHELYRPVKPRPWLLSAPSGPTIVTGAASLSGTGNLTTIGNVFLHAASALLTGTGSLTAVGSLEVSGVALLTGTGSLTAIGSLEIPGAAALTGTGSLTAVGSLEVLGVASLTGTGSLTAVGSLEIPGAASLSGAGSLTAQSLLEVSGIASLTGAGSLVAIGDILLDVVTGAASLAGVGSLTAQSLLEVPGVASLTGTGSLVTIGDIFLHTASASLTGAGSISAATLVIVTDSASLTGVGSMVVVGNVTGSSMIVAMFKGMFKGMSKGMGR